MSHYALFVFTDEYPTDEVLSNVLAPYDETRETEPYKDRLDPANESSWASRCEHLASFLEEKGITLKDYYDDTIQGNNQWHRDPGPLQQEFEKLHEDYRASWEYPIGKEEFTQEDLKRMYEALNALSEDDEDQVHLDSEGLYRWSTYNPKSRWDWWVIGGRWSGFLTLKDGLKGEKGAPGLMGSQHSEDGADIARLDEIDWDTMLKERSEGVGERWDRVRAVTDKLPNPPEHGDGRSAWQSWWKDPVVSEVVEAFKDPGDDFPFFGGPESIEYIFDMERDEYVDFIAWSGCLPFAYLDYEDGWVEPGRMGWFGMSDETKGSRLQFKEKVKHKVLASENEHRFVAVIDCHI